MDINIRIPITKAFLFLIYFIELLRSFKKSDVFCFHGLTQSMSSSPSMQKKLEVATWPNVPLKLHTMFYSRVWSERKWDIYPYCMPLTGNCQSHPLPMEKYEYQNKDSPTLLLLHAWV